MYSILVEDADINTRDFYKIIPTETKYQISNLESKQRNYMKIKIEGEKFYEDLKILITFVYSEKTKVDVTSISLRHFPSVDYMEQNRKNIYYLDYTENKIEQPFKINFYNTKKSDDFIYGLHSYVGNANVKVFTNYSYWDVEKQQVVNDYKLFKEFEVIEKAYDSKNID